MFCYNKVSEMHYISFFSMLENTNMYFSVVGELKYYESEIFHALQLKSWSTESIEVLPSIKTLFVLKNFADDSVLKHRRPESDWIKSFYTPFHFIWNYNPRLWRSAVHWKKHSTNNVFIGYILVKGKVIIWVCFENQNPCFFQGLILNRKN